MLRTLLLLAAFLLAPLWGTDSFTSATAGTPVLLSTNPLGFVQTGTYQVSGTFVATLQWQFSLDHLNWATYQTFTGPVGPVVFTAPGYYRFNCVSYTSGTAVGTVTLAPKLYQQQYASNGTLLFQVDDSGVTAFGLGSGAVSSVNALTGAVVFAAGSNITLTPSGQTITIASTGGGGSTPTGTGFIHVTSGTQDGASRAVNVSGADITGTQGVTNGGLGVATLTAYGPILGGTTSTGAVQSVAVGTSGQVFTSNGPGAAGSFQNAATGFTNPMTTLGDTIFGQTGGTAQRLAGNTTTTRQFFSSTGTGTVSAAPSLVGLAVSDIPNLPGSIITSGAVSPQFGGTGLDASTAANGKVFIGTGSGLALATLTAGANTTITNGSGTITIASSGSGGVSSLNSLTGALSITAGSGISVTPSGSSIAIAATGGGGFAGNYTTVSDAAYTMLSTDAIVAETTMTATRIITLPAASSVPVGRVELVEDLSGSLTQAINITISRAGSDTIEGGTVSWTIRTPKGWRSFVSDGVSNWHLVSMSRDVQFWVGAGTNTWTSEPGAKWGKAELIAGGAGGAGGAREPSGTASVGGGGGSGGAYTVRDFLVADAGASQSVVIGAGGTGGAGATTNGTAGANSTAGGNTTFGAGTAAVQTIALGAALSTGGGAGAGGTAGAQGQGSSPGGTAGAASTTGGGGNNASVVFGLGGGGGGPGGGIITAGLPFANGGHGASGGAYGSFYGQVGASGNVRGSVDGQAGGSPTNITPSGYAISGPGAGGGASSILTTGGAGGVGARPGGGGGGGGAALNGQNGGAGGAGGDGAAFITQGL